VLVFVGVQMKKSNKTTEENKKKGGGGIWFFPQKQMNTTAKRTQRKTHGFRGIGKCDPPCTGRKKTKEVSRPLKEGGPVDFR